MEGLINRWKSVDLWGKGGSSKLSQRLAALSPIIKDICHVSGTPGVSLGVLHRGEVVHIESLGYRDVEAKIPPDENTLYYIASLTKAFTAALVGMLVFEKKLTWQTPISTILPEFDHPIKTITEKAALDDFLSHRTGLAAKNQMWWLEYGVPSIPRRETMRFCSYLDVVHPFQKRWLYNNWGYGLADEVISKVAGVSWATFLRQRILDPLGMPQTCVDLNPKTENIAKAYMALADGTPWPVPRPSPEDDTVNEGAAAIQSNVVELLEFYKQIMFTAEEEKAGRMTSTPLRNMTHILQPHVNLEPESSPLERSYALGWIRTGLPGAVGKVGLNPMYVKEMPIVGKGMTDSQTCLYHNGSLQSFLSSVHLLPDSNTAIIVLTNSMANNDAADWIGQLLLEAVLDNPDKNDYLSIAQASAKESSALWPRMARELEKARTPDTSMRSVSHYVGTYWNLIGDWCIEVIEERGCLQMCFQKNLKQLYWLDHYHYDTFSWMLTRDQDVYKGRFPVAWPEFYLMEFREDIKDEMTQLVWKHDPDVPDGEIFFRKPPC